MPPVRVVFFRDTGGGAAALAGLNELLERGRKRPFARACVLVDRLGAVGHELRRPAAAHLRDGIHELRIRDGRIHYRLLYFFVGRSTAVLSHWIRKEGRVPDEEIERAIRNREAFRANPAAHTWTE